MTSIKSYSAALPRDMSADRVSDPRYCDRLTELPPSNGRGPGLMADCNSSPPVYHQQTATQQYMGAGGSPRVVAASTSIPFGVSAFCLGERDASNVSLQALTRGPPPPAAAAASSSLPSSSVAATTPDPRLNWSAAGHYCHLAIRCRWWCTRWEAVLSWHTGRHI